MLEACTVTFQKARIYAVDGATDYPIHGAWEHPERGWFPVQWTLDGFCSIPKRPDLYLGQTMLEVIFKKFNYKVTWNGGLMPIQLSKEAACLVQ